MPRLPQIKPLPLIKFFIKQGFAISRQVGSHVRLISSDGRKITIAVHNKSVTPGTLNSILKQAKMDRDTFLELFKK